MELIGKLKEKVNQAESKEEVKNITEEAGFLLSDTELDKVAGGRPDELGPGEVMPIDILYHVSDSAADMFASAEPASADSSMDRYLKH